MSFPAPKDTGRGKYFFPTLTATEAKGMIYNFDINGPALKTDHEQILKAGIVRVLENRGSIALVGHASTTGAADFDRTLSQMRLDNVVQFLKRNTTKPFSVSTSIARGKSAALAVGGVDNHEDEKWRAVWIHAWDKTTPPPQPVDPSGGGLPGAPITPGAVILGQATDVAGGVLGLAELGADILGLTAAATAASIGGLIASTLGGMIAMPAIWMAADKLAEFNGFVQGYADAMQDMADAFSDPALDRKPLREWPPIPEPKPHTAGPNPQASASQQMWLNGQARGCRQAYIDILKMETNPKEVDVVFNGRNEKLKLNGKRFLRGLSANYKDNVGVKVIEIVNAELKKAGKSPFPTRG